MSLPKYRILVNGLYLRGWDDSETVGKSGHMGWQPRAVEMSKMLMTRLKDQTLIEYIVKRLLGVWNKNKI